jgi:predicted TIM-barrel fold metal-dependent hydrolase
LFALCPRHVIGVDRIMWSTNFPHNNGPWPDSQAIIKQHMVGVPDEEQRMILRDNAVRTYGF